MIESKKGTIRANHYHPQQEQKCLFTKGQIIEIFQDMYIFFLSVLMNANACKVEEILLQSQMTISVSSL